MKGLGWFVPRQFSLNYICAARAVVFAVLYISIPSIGLDNWKWSQFNIPHQYIQYIPEIGDKSNLLSRVSLVVAGI